MKVRLLETALAIGKYRQVRLPTVAAELAPYAEVSICDENIEPVDFSPTDLVGITAQAYNAPRAVYLAGQFKERGIPTIVGGPWATIMKDRALEHFDAVVVGEVEGLGEKIIRDLERGELSGVYRLDEPPADWGGVPRRGLQKADKYLWVNYPMEFSRGCPHRCSFCFCRHGQPGFRPRSLQSIEADLNNWDHGLIEAVDFHFAGDRNHALEVCRLLEQKKVWGWYGEATLPSLDDDRLLDAMARSGCRALFVGIESVDEKVLSGVNKSFNPVSRYGRIIKKVRDHGIFVHAGIVWGLDGQTTDSFRRTEDFCRSNDIYLVSTNLATWFPGSPEYEKKKQQGLLLTEDERRFDGLHVVARPDSMEPEEVVAGAKKFAKGFYSNRSIMERSLQPANSNLAIWTDYWAFNWIYKSYYKDWVKKLETGSTNWKAKDPQEAESFPLVGGRLPFSYAWYGFWWKIFHILFSAWQRPPKPANKGITSALILAWALAGWQAFDWVLQNRVAAWPLVWPPAWVVILIYIPAGGTSAWLAARLARSGPLNRVLGLVLATAAVLPLYLLCLAMHPAQGFWAWILAFFSLAAWMKSMSLVLEKQHGLPNLYRVGNFLFWWPGLSWERAYVEDLTRQFVGRHLGLAFAGWLRLAAGGLLFGVMIWMFLFAPAFPGSQILGSLGRLFCLYFLVRGFYECTVYWWRVYGFEAGAPFGRKCLGPAAPSQMWRGWMRTVYRWHKKNIYIPLGGENRPFSATLAVFGFSGLVWSLLLWPVAGSFPLPVLGFFLANGALCALEKRAAALFPGRQGRAWTWLWYGASVAVFLATAPWLFAFTDRIFI